MADTFRSYTTIEVARRLGVSLQTVQRWVDAGHLKAWRTPGGHRRVDAESADRLFREQQGGDPGAEDAGAGSSRALKVLVVDDSAMDLALLVAHVRALLPTAEVETASDGFQALLRIGHAVPDVLVTDLHMPHLDGFEMLRSLATGDGPRPRRLIAVSSLSPSEMAARGRLLPDVRFASKPVAREWLAAALADLPESAPTPAPTPTPPSGPAA